MNFVALDIAIGLIVVYLVLSLAVLSINEGIATVFNLRAKGLASRLALLLGDGGKPGAERLVDALYAHPLVDALHEEPLIPWRDRKQPSYIPSRTFVLSLIDVLAARSGEGPPRPPFGGVTSRGALQELIGQSVIPEALRRQLQLVVGDAQDDLEKAKVALETWFNNAMDRAGAVYKTRIQTIGVAVGVVLAFASNADTIAITHTLANTPAVREALVAQAQKIVRVPLESPSRDSLATDSLFRSTADKLRRLSGAGIPLGFPERPRAAMGFRDRAGYYLGIIWRGLPGLLLTALAVSLGAPFWFDLLNKVMTVRGAGRSPDEPLPAGRTAGK